VKKYTVEVKAVGKNLKRLRNEKGISQQELADLCDMERSTIVRVESGIYGAGLHVLFAIAEVLQVDIKTLFEGI